MKLTNYTISQMKAEIEKFLFIKWLESDLDDWQDHEMRELWLLYHEIFVKQCEVVE
jgi:hypothetical protein